MLLLEKRTNRPIDVCDIRYDKHGYPTFLYYQDGQWLQKSGKYFEPMNRKKYSDLVKRELERRKYWFNIIVIPWDEMIDTAIFDGVSSSVAADRIIEEWAWANYDAT